MDAYIEQLNAKDKMTRLNALCALKNCLDTGEIASPSTGRDVNSHIHTSYSFSPYSPTMAVWKSYMAGLCTTGIMDHDTVAGAKEFIVAGEILHMPVTVGMEMRADFTDTALEGKRMNNPDQVSKGYVTIHGIPHQNIQILGDFMQPYRAARGRRNAAMCSNINKLVEPAFQLDYEEDVLPLSMAHDSGSVTERHLSFALAKKIQKCYQGATLIEYLVDDLKLSLSQSVKERLSDAQNPFVEYDLLGAFKAGFVERFFIPATDECPPIRDMIALADELGAIIAMPYLGDVGESVTGDKKPQKFEDDYLDLWFETVVALGIKAVTYMPSRNTLAQLKRVRALCEQHGRFQISGEDINQPRQQFVCDAMRDPEFSNLTDAAWALIGHELKATRSIDDGMFSGKTLSAMPALQDRIAYFRDYALSQYEI